MSVSRSFMLCALLLPLLMLLCWRCPTMAVERAHPAHAPEVPRIAAPAAQVSSWIPDPPVDAHAAQMGARQELLFLEGSYRGPEGAWTLSENLGGTMPWVVRGPRVTCTFFEDRFDDGWRTAVCTTPQVHQGVRLYLVDHGALLEVRFAGTTYELERAR